MSTDKENTDELLALPGPLNLGLKLRERGDKKGRENWFAVEFNAPPDTI